MGVVEIYRKPVTISCPPDPPTFQTWGRVPLTSWLRRPGSQGSFSLSDIGFNLENLLATKVGL